MKLANIVPILASGHLRRTIDFYTGTLGFTCQGTFGDPENPAWCYLRGPGADAAALMFTQAPAGAEAPRLPGSLYCYVADVRAAWERLKDAAPVVYPLTRFEHKMVEFSLRDPDGYQLMFGQDEDQVSDLASIPVFEEEGCEP